jgi:hypothetical protein
MNALPRVAKYGLLIGQHAHDVPDLGPRESVVFPNLDRPPRTIQIEHRFITSSDHMDVRRPMIVWVDDCPQSFKS